MDVQRRRTAAGNWSVFAFTLLLEMGVPVYLGVDNIADLFMPIVDGDMWFECRMLMEACRFYDLDAVADWACALTPAQAKAVAQLRAKNAAAAPRQLSAVS